MVSTFGTSLFAGLLCTDIIGYANVEKLAQYRDTLQRRAEGNLRRIEAQ